MQDGAMPAPFPRLLLIQVRDHAGAEQHERECVAARLDRPVDSLTAWNFIKRPDLSHAHAESFDVVVLGGAGSHSVTEDDPFVAPLLDLTRRLVEAGRPFFGSCYGHQLLARALGGTVVTDLDHAEVGTIDVAPTPAGRADPLLEGVQDSFAAHVGHNDRVDVVPAGATVLASSERCSVHVLRVDGLPVYGTQFHGEMDSDAMRARIAVYGDSYIEGPEAKARVLAGLRDTPFVAGLMRKFVDLYV